MAQNRDDGYLALLLKPIRACAQYRPKMGRGGKTGMDLEQFQSLYQADAFYSWFGLDNPLMYAAHKAAGGMTSVYRQIGAGCERLFRRILRDELDISAEDSKWSYEIVGANKKKRKLTLDGRIPLASVSDEAQRSRIADWMRRAAAALDVDTSITGSLAGVVFEIRQGIRVRMPSGRTPTSRTLRRHTRRRTCRALLSSQRRLTATSRQGIEMRNGRYWSAQRAAMMTCQASTHSCET